MYQKGEIDNNCDSIIRINQYTSDYSFFHYYTCILNDLKIKDYENALKCLNSFYKIIEPDLLKLESTSVTNFYGEIYKSDYAFFSLKGYLLSKLNKKAEAKLAYKEALKLNPECKEALDEIKLLQ
jgi:tetratricopeptide (TPR) repeat protein